jgi:hypothetical protein
MTPDKLKSFRTICGLLFFFLLPIDGTANQSGKVFNVENFQTPLSDDSPVTYLDLVKKVFPDARADTLTGAEADKSIELDHLFGDYRKRVFEGDMSINRASVLRIRNSGASQLLLLLDVSSEDGSFFQWGGMSVLALFSVDQGMRLLDAVDVQADRFTFFPEKQQVLRIHPHQDAVLIVNHHFNSGDSYLAYSLIAFVDNRLRDVFAKMPLLTGDNHCGTNFTETPHFTVLTAPLKGHRNLLLKIRLRKLADGAACERREPAFARDFDYLLVWRPALNAYVASRNATRSLRRTEKALGIEL